MGSTAKTPKPCRLERRRRIFGKGASRGIVCGTADRREFNTRRGRVRGRTANVRSWRCPVRGLCCAFAIALAALGATLMAQGRQIFPGNANLPFSAAVKADGLVYVAGTIA